MALPNDHQPDPLTRAVLELERHVAGDGWDGPLRVFALLRTAQAIAADPELRQQLPAELVAAADADPDTITSIEQEDLPEGEGVEEILGQIGWPPTVDGAAVVLERFVVPPEAESDLPEDPTLAVQALLNHPQRQDVRLAVAVLRDGSTCCAVRQRAHDEDHSVGVGADLAPGLVAALRETLS